MQTILKIEKQQDERKKSILNRIYTFCKLIIKLCRKKIPVMTDEEIRERRNLITKKLQIDTVRGDSNEDVIYCSADIDVDDITPEKLMELKDWYISAVEGCLILRGMYKEQAQDLMKKYRLKERIELFPEIQLHYDIEVVADEICKLVNDDKKKP